jgi:hypothetical protein
MFSYRAQYAPQVDKFGTVEVKGFDGGPAGGGASDDQGKVLAPLEVTGPLLEAGIEERHHAPRHRIAGVGLGVFVIVARWTRPR